MFFLTIAPLLLSVLATLAGRAYAATCEVAGGTSDDTAAIKAALSSCNNGGTVSDNPILPSPNKPVPVRWLCIPPIRLCLGETSIDSQQVLLDKAYTIGSVLQTTSLNNVAIELTGTLILGPSE